MIETLPESAGYTQICLVEDDPIMGESIVSRFELEGLSIHWHQDAASARQALLNNDYGLVISDIRLPDRNGDRLFEDLLEQQLLLPPFIFITGFGDLNRAVNLLKLGAADYLTKPFHIEELLARVNALLRRSAGHSSPQLSFNGIQIDTVAQTVQTNGEAVTLTETGEDTGIFRGLIATNDNSPVSDGILQVMGGGNVLADHIDSLGW